MNEGYYSRSGFGMAGAAVLSQGQRYEGHDLYGRYSRDDVVANPNGPRLFQQAAGYFAPDNTLVTMGASLLDNHFMTVYPALNTGTLLQARAGVAKAATNSKLKDAYGALIAANTSINQEEATTAMSIANMFGLLENPVVGDWMSRLKMDTPEMDKKGEFAAGLNASASQRASFLRYGLGAYTPEGERRQTEFSTLFNKAYANTGSSIFAGELTTAAGRFGLDSQTLDSASIAQFKQTTEVAGKRATELLDAIDKMTKGTVSSLGPKLQTMLKDMQNGIAVFGRSFEYMQAASMEASNTLDKMGVRAPEQITKRVLARERMIRKADLSGSAISGFELSAIADAKDIEFMNSDVARILSVAQEMGATDRPAFNRLLTGDHTSLETSTLLNDVIAGYQQSDKFKKLPQSVQISLEQNGGNGASRQVLSGARESQGTVWTRIAKAASSNNINASNAAILKPYIERKDLPGLTAAFKKMAEGTTVGYVSDAALGAIGAEVFSIQTADDAKLENQVTDGLTKRDFYHQFLDENTVDPTKTRQTTTALPLNTNPSNPLYGVYTWANGTVSQDTDPLDLRAMVAQAVKSSEPIPAAKVSEHRDSLVGKTAGELVWAIIDAIGKVAKAISEVFPKEGKQPASSTNTPTVAPRGQSSTTT